LVNPLDTIPFITSIIERKNVLRINASLIDFELIFVASLVTTLSCLVVDIELEYNETINPNKNKNCHGGKRKLKINNGITNKVRILFLTLALIDLIR
jgi:hypothetical protein